MIPILSRMTMQNQPQKVKLQPKQPIVQEMVVLLHLSRLAHLHQQDALLTLPLGKHLSMSLWKYKKGRRKKVWTCMGIAYQELNMNILFKKTNRSLFTAEKMTTWTDSHTGLKKESLVELVSSRKKLTNDCSTNISISCCNLQC